MKQITVYTENGRTFVICKDERGYWAFEDKYIVDGKLIKEFNGITGKLTKTFKEVYQRVRDQIHYDMLIEAGVDKEGALRHIFSMN